MIIWDHEKNAKLQLERNISFEQIADLIMENKVLDILEHPRRKNQNIFVIDIDHYIYAVLFLLDDQDNIILKTAFPSRKLMKKYRG
jgi:uncharacterized DUF497 family protein